MLFFRCAQLRRRSRRQIRTHTEDSLIRTCTYRENVTRFNWDCWAYLGDLLEQLALIRIGLGCRDAVGTSFGRVVDPLLAIGLFDVDQGVFLLSKSIVHMHRPGKNHINKPWR